jgi:hypothetical protein
MSEEPERITYTLEQAAQALGVSRTGLWRQIRAGNLQSFRYAGRTLILATDLLAAVTAASEARQAAKRPPGRPPRSSPKPGTPPSRS